MVPSLKDTSGCWGSRSLVEFVSSTLEALGLIPSNTHSWPFASCAITSVIELVPEVRVCAACTAPVELFAISIAVAIAKYVF